MQTKILSATQKHNLWKRLVKSLRAEFPVLRNFNMYGFINEEDINIYETIKTEIVGEWVKMTDFKIFGLRYHYLNTKKENIDAFVKMIKETPNYKKYMEEYVLKEEHSNRLTKVGLSVGVEVIDNSLCYKKSITLKSNGSSLSFKSSNIVKDIEIIYKFAS